MRHPIREMDYIGDDDRLVRHVLEGELGSWVKERVYDGNVRDRVR
jgi:hypothetical protein